jgi:DNA-directed RNA polymerase subunit RPC12/RpoP
MLQTLRPTPTCTRFQTSIEMPCMKCGKQMRLATIEPRDQNYDVLTYRCTPCDSGESFLKAR